MTMRDARRGAMLLAGIGVIAGILTGCAATPAPISLTDETVVIDARTAAEYGSGHLEGAVNLDAQSPAFSVEVATLDPEVEYVVYCRSGNRSAQAAAVLEGAGLDVIDAGGIDRAGAATGLEVVR